MSIADTMQSTTLPPGKIVAKSGQPRRNRIRRGQKLDEVVSLSEHRLNQLASGAAEAKTAASNTPSTSASTSSLAVGSSASGGDSPFQLQEYLSMLVHRDPHNVEAITSLPTEADIESLTSSTDKGKGKDEPEDDAIFQNVDTDVWVYEQLRRLVLDLTTPWLTSLQQECDKHIRPSTCAAMNAGDWMYLCASHGEEKQCCAIDYMVHTLDGATSLLNSARHFPSRTYVPNTSLRHFGSIARRLSRIFVHAWCYHKDVFLACEAETSLYSRFHVLVETYDLTATDNLPPRPGHGSTKSPNPNSAAYSVDDTEFSRSTTTAAFSLNGTTAKRERSGTAASRSLLSQSLQQSQLQDDSAASGADAVGLVPPPAPSPRPTAILSRPDHEEGDDDAPAWTSFPHNAASNFIAKQEDDEEDEDEESGEADTNDRTQKIGHRAEEQDATISLRAVDIPAGLTAANGFDKAEKVDAAEEDVNAGRNESLESEEATNATEQPLS